MQQVNVFEALFGKQGEVLIESLESNLKFCTGIFKNGMFEKRIHTIGEFVRQVNTTEVPYLNVECQPSFKMLLPKIPSGMLRALEAFYTHVSKTVKSEVAAQIFWDTLTSSYVLHVPIQQVTGSTVRYDRKNGMFVDPRYVCVCNSHSHNTFGAFYSGVDNASEVDTCTYLVIGNVTTNYTYAVRAGCNGSYTILTLNDIFDFSDATDYEINHAEMSKITELKYVAPTYATYPGYVGAKGAVRPYSRPETAASSRVVSAYEDWAQYYQDYYSDLYDVVEDPLAISQPLVAANTNYNIADTEYYVQLNEFATAYNLFAQAIVDDPHAADLGYTFTYDIVQLMDGLDYAHLDMMKAFFDNYYMYLSRTDIENLVLYISQNL